MNRLRKWKRNCCLLVVIGIVLALLLCIALLALVRRAQAQEVNETPLDVLLLIDHSDSMWEKGGVGSDPHLLRLEAAGLFLSYLGLDVGRSGHRLGIIYFGTESRLVAPLTPLTDAAQRAAIREALTPPPPMGGTDPLQALRMAYEEIFLSPRHSPDRQPVVVLLTDGKPELPSLSTPERKAAYVDSLRDLADRFRDRGCPIFTIALTSEATDADPEIQTVYRNLWQEIAARTPPGEYYEARTARDLPPIYHSIVAHLLGTDARSPVVETKVEGRRMVTVTVEEEVSRLVLSVFKSAGSIQVQLFRPGGALARPGDPDVRHLGGTEGSLEEIWSIANPRPGLWRVELSGHGEVLIWKDTTLSPDAPAPAYTILVDAPPPYVPAGRSLEIACAVRDGTGIVVRTQALQVIVELRRAGFPEAPLLARDDGLGGDPLADDGTFTARHLAIPPGAYTFVVRAVLQGQEVARREGAFEAVPLPTLEVLSPLPGSRVWPGDPVTVALRVVAGPASLDGAALQAAGVLSASIEGPDGPLHPLHLSAGPEGRLEARFPAPRAEGVYTLSVRLRGRSAEGFPFDETRVIPFFVVAPRRTSPGWLWIVLAVLTVGGGVGAALLIARRHRPVLEGQWRVLDAPQGCRTGQVIELPGQAAVTLGGHGKDALALPGGPALEAPVASLRAGRGPEGEMEIWLSPLEGAASASPTVNGRPLSYAHRLEDGDVLSVGGYRLRYENLRQAADRLAQRRPRRGAKYSSPPTGLAENQRR